MHGNFPLNVSFWGFPAARPLVTPFRPKPRLFFASHYPHSDITESSHLPTLHPFFRKEVEGGYSSPHRIALSVLSLGLEIDQRTVDRAIIASSQSTLPIPSFVHPPHPYTSPLSLPQLRHPLPLPFSNVQQGR